MKCTNNCSNGFIYSKNSLGEEVVTKCSCLKSKQYNIYKDIVFKNSKLPETIKKYNIDKDYLGRESIINIDIIKEFINNFEEHKSVSLYFFSKETGCQKTTLSQYICRELLYAGYKCYFVLFADFIRTVESEGFNKEETSFKNELLTCDLLILDDCFDKKKNTIYQSGFQLAFLDKFFRNRMEILNKSIIFTSNYNISEINEDIFGVSLKSLLHRNITFKGNELEFKDNVYSNLVKRNSDNIDVHTISNSLLNRMRDRNKSILL